MNKVEYQNYLKSDHWQDFKTLVRKVHNGNHCGICGSSYGLDIHHLNYKRLGKERLSDVIVLCRNCHEKLHKGEIKKKDVKYSKAIRKLCHQPFGIGSLKVWQRKLAKDKKRRRKSNKFKVVHGKVSDKKKKLKKMGAFAYYAQKRK